MLRSPLVAAGIGSNGRGDGDSFVRIDGQLLVSADDFAAMAFGGPDGPAGRQMNYFFTAIVTDLPATAQPSLAPSLSPSSPPMPSPPPPSPSRPPPSPTPPPLPPHSRLSLPPVGCSRRQSKHCERSLWKCALVWICVLRVCVTRHKDRHAHTFRSGDSDDRMHAECWAFLLSLPLILRKTEERINY